MCGYHTTNASEPSFKEKRTDIHSKVCSRPCVVVLFEESQTLSNLDSLQ